MQVSGITWKWGVFVILSRQGVRLWGHDNMTYGIPIQISHRQIGSITPQGRWTVARETVDRAASAMEAWLQPVVGWAGGAQTAGCCLAASYQ